MVLPVNTERASASGLRTTQNWQAGVQTVETLQDISKKKAELDEWMSQTQTEMRKKKAETSTAVDETTRRANKAVQSKENLVENTAITEMISKLSTSELLIEANELQEADIITRNITADNWPAFVASQTGSDNKAIQDIIALGSYNNYAKSKGQIAALSASVLEATEKARVEGEETRKTNSAKIAAEGRETRKTDAASAVEARAKALAIAKVSAQEKIAAARADAASAEAAANIAYTSSNIIENPLALIPSPESAKSLIKGGLISSGLASTFGDTDAEKTNIVTAVVEKIYQSARQNYLNDNSRRNQQLELRLHQERTQGGYSDLTVANLKPWSDYVQEATTSAVTDVEMSGSAQMIMPDIAQVETFYNRLLTRPVVRDHLSTGEMNQEDVRRLARYWLNYSKTNDIPILELERAVVTPALGGGPSPARNVRDIRKGQ